MAEEHRTAHFRQEIANEITLRRFSNYKNCSPRVYFTKSVGSLKISSRDEIYLPLSETKRSRFVKFRSFNLFLANDVPGNEDKKKSCSQNLNVKLLHAACLFVLDVVSLCDLIYTVLQRDTFIKRSNF